MFQVCCIASGFFSDLANNVLAEFVALAIIVIIGWLFFRRRRRQTLLAFFGVRSSKNLVAYVSDLLIPSGGSVDATGQPRSYQGHVVPFGEAREAYRFHGLFNTVIPGLSDLQGLWKHVFLSEIEVQIEPAPTPQSIDVTGTVVTTGSPGYNRVSGWAERALSPMIRFGSDNQCLVSSTNTYHATSHFAFVQRLWDKVAGRPVFYAAGLDELGAMGAIHHLISRWDQLLKKFGAQDDFAIVIEVNTLDFRDAVVLEVQARKRIP
jgi:hypothetical protein